MKTLSQGEWIGVVLAVFIVTLVFVFGGLFFKSSVSESLEHGNSSILMDDEV